MRWRGALRLVSILTLLWLLSDAATGSATASATASGELTVIFDNGQARPLSELLGPFERTAPDSASVAAGANQLGAADITALLPIRSPGLTPGRVMPRTHSIPFAKPFFLIGADAWSKRWLLQHRQVLKDMGAVGLLVEASSIEDLQDIARIADGLPIAPASGSDLANALGIEHYPVAITAQRIWQ